MVLIPLSADASVTARLPVKHSICVSTFPRCVCPPTSKSTSSQCHNKHPRTDCTAGALPYRSVEVTFTRLTDAKREDCTHTKTGDAELTYIAAKTKQPWTFRTVCPVAVGREPFGAELESKAAASRRMAHRTETCDETRHASRASLYGPS